MQSTRMGSLMEELILSEREISVLAIVDRSISRSKILLIFLITFSTSSFFGHFKIENHSNQKLKQLLVRVSYPGETRVGLVLTGTRLTFLPLTDNQVFGVIPFPETSQLGSERYTWELQDLQQIRPFSSTTRKLC